MVGSCWPTETPYDGHGALRALCHACARPASTTSSRTAWHGVDRAPYGRTERQRPRPTVFGRGMTERPSVAVLPRARPEQRVAFTAFIIEQVRVDRSGEGRIVELERKVVAALLGALRPGCSDLGAACVDAVAGSVL